MSSPDAVVALANGHAAQDAAPPSRPAQLSAWSASRAKRLFDVAAVCALAPLLCPLLLIIAAAVRLSSPGGAIFRQTRIGSHGRPFTILKFRTMVEATSDEEPGLACASAGRITAVGLMLRKFKVDELPQVINVLRGDMSLVGPRPRIAAQQLGTFPCRPGITGVATLAFAREDILLARLPPEGLAHVYHDHIMPAKHRLDSDYMAGATLLSDVQILVRTVLGCWRVPGVLQPSDLPAVHLASRSEVICRGEAV
ncbi:MAG TPA: sugar transferase [Terracidiphilus sp.]